jgi:predicted DNA-binding ArsR family transcriptional regulator
MAPTLGLVDRSEMEGVFVGDTRAESSQASQMSSSNRSNGGTHLDGDTASQSERGSVYESNLQASGEELRHAAVTPHDAITAEALMEPPQPAPAPAPHPGLLSELIRMQEERDRMQEERDAEVARVYNQIRTTAMLQAQMAEQQAQMSEQHRASRAESRAHFQAVLSQFNSVQEAQRKSDEKAQKAQDEVKKMKEEFNVMVEANEDEGVVVVAVKTSQQKVADEVRQAYIDGSVIDLTKSTKLAEEEGNTTLAAQKPDEDDLTKSTKLAEEEGNTTLAAQKPDEDSEKKVIEEMEKNEKKAIEEMIKNDIEYAAECAALEERSMNPNR